MNDSLGTIKASKIKEAIGVLDDDANVSFEYLVASFFPKAFENMQSLLKDAYTQGFIQGTNNLK